MQLPKSFTTVTLFSKSLALTLFLLLPFLGFYLGMEYQKLNSYPEDSKLIFNPYSPPLKAHRLITPTVSLEPTRYILKTNDEKIDYSKCHGFVTPTTLPNNYTNEEINSFPIYPNSKFIKKEDWESYSEGCKPVESAIENAIVYYWETPDDFFQIDSWYKEDKSNSGWVCAGGTGGAGGARDSWEITNCKKGKSVYTLSIMPIPDEIKTEIKLIVPKS